VFASQQSARTGEIQARRLPQAEVTRGGDDAERRRRAVQAWTVALTIRSNPRVFAAILPPLNAAGTHVSARSTGFARLESDPGQTSAPPVG